MKRATRYPTAIKLGRLAYADGRQRLPELDPALKALDRKRRDTDALEQSWRLGWDAANLETRVPINPEPKCELCGVQGEIEETQLARGWNYRHGVRMPDQTVKLATVKVHWGGRKMALCDHCHNGLADGRYAAVAAAHELHGIKLGHTFTIHPEIAKQEAGKPGARLTTTRPLTFAAVLKAHGYKPAIVADAA